jgi:hypothetical protein
MKFKYTFILGFLFPLLSIGQTLEKPIPIQRSYFATVSEGILSIGGSFTITYYDPNTGLRDYTFPTDNNEPAIRFSSFFHVGEQFHVNLGKLFGLYTGLGVRNIGMINGFGGNNLPIKIKQRVYSLGIPAGIKIGDMQKRLYLSLGAELELFFNYKQKTFVVDRKVEKFNEWFSDRTPLINPSFFVEINFKKFAYIKLRSYPLNFLVDDKQNFTVNNIKTGFRPTDSQLFALSFGRVIGQKRK